MDQPTFKSIGLTFMNPDDAAIGIQGFIDATPDLQDIIHISHVVVAVAKKKNNVLELQPNQPPQMEYQFKYLIVYVT